MPITQSRLINLVHIAEQAFVCIDGIQSHVRTLNRDIREGRMTVSDAWSVLENVILYSPSEKGRMLIEQERWLYNRTHKDNERHKEAERRRRAGQNPHRFSDVSQHADIKSTFGMADKFADSLSDEEYERLMAKINDPNRPEPTTDDPILQAIILNEQARKATQPQPEPFRPNSSPSLGLPDEPDNLDPQTGAVPD